MKKDIFQRNLIKIIFAFGIFILFVLNFQRPYNQHFIYLAKSFTQGKLYFSVIPSIWSWADSSLFNGYYYWPLGMFPSILLIPFVVIFKTGFLQGYISFPLTLLNIFLLYKISSKITQNKISSWFLSFAYVFSTSYIMVATYPVSWYFAHTVATTCLLFSLFFTLIKLKPILAGIFFTFSFLTRISLVFGGVFFLLYFLLCEKQNFIKKYVLFGIPVIFGVLLFFWYNFARFGSVFETGYKYQILPPEHTGNREIGMWNIKHVPTNLYLFLLKGPVAKYENNSMVMKRIYPSKWGMSFIFTSPIFLYLGLADMKKRLNILAAVTSLAMFAFLAGSFGMGAYQYGYRFALDFQPFLFLILCDVFKDRKIGAFTALLIVSSYVFNLHMITMFFYQQ